MPVVGRFCSVLRRGPSAKLPCPPGPVGAGGVDDGGVGGERALTEGLDPEKQGSSRFAFAFQFRVEVQNRERKGRIRREIGRAHV